MRNLMEELDEFMVEYNTDFNREHAKQLLN